LIDWLTQKAIISELIGEFGVAADVASAAPPNEVLAHCLESFRTGSTTLLSLQRIKDAAK